MSITYDESTSATPGQFAPLALYAMKEHWADMHCGSEQSAARNITFARRAALRVPMVLPALWRSRNQDQSSNGSLFTLQSSQSERLPVIGFLSTRKHLSLPLLQWCRLGYRIR